MEKNRKQHSTEHQRRLRMRITTLLEGAGPKRLNNRQRLIAAAQIGLHTKAIRASGSSMLEICELLGERMQKGTKSGSVEPFRLHRWMLKGGATGLTDTLVAQYKDRAEPLRSTATYLKLLEHLALMAGVDPLDSQGALLVALDLTAGKIQPEDDTALPEQRLAALINEYAAVVAQKLDLAYIIQRADRLQIGCNLKLNQAEIVDLATKDLSLNFRSTEAVDCQFWYEDTAPLIPSVAIARLPFGWLPGPFHLTNQEGETVERSGQAVTYWELHLAVGPTGPLSVGAYLLRSSSVDLEIDGNHFTLPDLRDELQQFETSDPWAPTIELNGNIWSVTCASTPVYRKQRAGLSEDPPSETIPTLHIAPVSASSLRAWLITPMDFVVDDGPFISIVDRLALPNLDAIGWIRAESIARSLEIALRDGRLDEAFQHWLDRYQPAAEKFEQDWLENNLEMDAALRTRFMMNDLDGATL